MEGRGLYVNESTSEVPEYGAVVPEAAVIKAGGGEYVLLRKGKKNHQILRVQFG
jgi:hypothetical protein